MTMKHHEDPLSYDLFAFLKTFACLELGRLWYAKVLSVSLATIEKYRISFNRNTVVVNDHFTRAGHTTFNCMKSDIQNQLNKNINLL